MENIDFVALSYLWGKPKEHGSEKGGQLPASFGAWKSENGLQAVLPKTIEDSMTVVTNLGYRYLWVDRYCIPQGGDRESIQVRAEMIAVMGSIYATSTFTIIQAAGEGPEDGLAGVSADSRYVQPAIALDDHRCIVGIGTPASNIRLSAWDTRGWTFQEGVLSRRRLVFTHCQAYFQCREMQCTESLSASIPFDHDILSAAIFPPYYHDGQKDEDRDEQYEPWVDRQTLEAFDFIERYAGRKFTYPGDAYDAFRGITTLFRSRNPPLYCFKGLPIISPAPRHNLRSAQRRESEGQVGVAEPSEEMKELAFALSWHFQGSFIMSHREPPPMVRRIQFPSWTWLGWGDCPRDYEFHLFNDLRDRDSGPAMKTYYLRSVEIQYADGTAVQWDTDWREVCVKSDTKQIDALKIDGWTFPFTLKNEHRFSEHMEARMQDEFGGQETHEFTCLFLASSHATGDASPDDEELDDEKFDPHGYAPEGCGTIFCFLLLSPSPSHPGWYERLDLARLTYFGGNLDANLAKLKAQSATIFLS
jgi:hypothetical protein